MSYKNDSNNRGSSVKGQKGSQTGSRNVSGQGTSQRGKTSSQARGNRGGINSFQPQDIKSLVHNQGRANFGGQEWALKTPSWNDATLQAIISDPKLTVKASSKQTTDGKLTYELRGHGKTINVTIAC